MMAQFKFSSKAKYHSSMLAELQKVGNHEDTTTLQSDGKSVGVHSVILSFTSHILSDLLTSSEPKLLILPGFSAILPDCVRLVYTGEVTSMTDQDTVLLTSLCEQLGMDISVRHRSTWF